MKRTRTDRSPSPEQRFQIEDTQQTVAAAEQHGRPPTLSSHPVLATAFPASSGRNAAPVLPAFNLALVDRAEAAVNTPDPTGTQIHDLPADLANTIAQLLGTEKDRLAWDLSCKQHYRMPNTVREIRLVEQLFAATRHVPAALQNAVQLSPLSEELFSPQAKTLIKLHAIDQTGKAQGCNAQGVSWTQVASDMLEAISAEELEGAFAAYATWIKLPGVLMRDLGDLPVAHNSAGLAKPCFLIAPVLVQRMQQPGLCNDAATLKSGWLDALIQWSLRCNGADLDHLDPSEHSNEGLNFANNPVLPLSSLAHTIIGSTDNTASPTPQWLALLVAVGMRNYLVFSSGELGGTPLNPASAALFQKLATPRCFETVKLAAQALDESARAALCDAVASNILSLQEHRRWSDFPLSHAYPQQAASMLVCSLLMMLNRSAIEAGDKTGIKAISLSMQALETELWVIRKILSESNVPGFPSHIDSMAEPDSAESEETDTTAIGWDAAFDIIDKHDIATTPSNPLTELDTQSFESSQDFLPNQGWEFDHEQVPLLKSIHLTTRTFHDLTQYIALLPKALDIAPLKQQLRAIADLWPHDIQRNILLDWVNALR